MFEKDTGTAEDVPLAFPSSVRGRTGTETMEMRQRKKRVRVMGWESRRKRVVRSRV